MKIETIKNDFPAAYAIAEKIAANPQRTTAQRIEADELRQEAERNGWTAMVRQAAVDLSTKTFEVKTSNGAFYQIHRVRAASSERAEALAKTDADKALAEERRNAAQMGHTADSVRPYEVFSVRVVEGDNDGAMVRFVDSGAEG